MSNPVTPAPAPAPAATVAPTAPAATEPVTPAATPDATVTPAAETAVDLSTLTPAELAAEVSKWKALSRKNEDQAKSNADKAREYDALKDSEKTELQKAQDELARIQGELDTTKGEALKNSVAAAKGVPAALLTGGTREELEATADALLAFRGVPRVPAQDAAASTVTGAPVTGATDQITTRDQLASMSTAEVNEARLAGRLDTLLGRSK